MEERKDDGKTHKDAMSLVGDAVARLTIEVGPHGGERGWRR